MSGESSDAFWNYYPKNDMARSLFQFRKRPVKKLSINGHNWLYYRGGDASETILFVHGMGGSYDIWWQQITEFETGYTVLSVTYPALSRLREIADGLVHILDTENVAPVIVVGTSLGGYIAQYMASYYPKYVKKAVFGNTFPPNDLYRRTNGWKVRFLRHMSDSFVRKKVRKVMLDEIPDDSEPSQVLRGYIKEMFDKTLDKNTLLARYNCVIEKFEPCGTRCKPALALFESENDQMIPPELREMLKSRYRFELVHTFGTGGHFPYLYVPGEYNEALKKFITAR